MKKRIVTIVLLVVLTLGTFTTMAMAKVADLGQLQKVELAMVMDGEVSVQPAGGAVLGKVADASVVRGTLADAGWTLPKWLNWRFWAYQLGCDRNEE